MLSSVRLFLQIIKFTSFLKAGALAAASTAVLSGAAIAQLGGAPGVGDQAAQVRKILDQVKAIGIVDGKAVAGKTEEACSMLAKADSLLKVANDADLTKTASELKKILECK